MSDIIALQQEIGELKKIIIEGALHKERGESNSPFKQLYKQIDDQYNSLKESNSTLQKELDSTKQTLQTTQEELKKANQELGEFKTQFATKSQEAERLSQELKTTRDNLVTKEGELKATTQSLQEAQLQKQTLEDEKNNLKEANSSLQTELDSTKQTLQTTQANLDNTNQELNSLKPQFDAKSQEAERLSVELKEAQKELQDLKCQTHIEIYEQYRSLPSDFRSEFSFIKDKSLFAFIASAGTSNTISKLYGLIRNKMISNERCDDLIDLFNTLLEIQVTYQENFERLTTTEGEDFETSEHIKIGNGPSSGKVEKVILRGYKDGNTIYQSLVEVGIG